MNNKRRLGAYKEKLAEAYLEAQGLKIIERNYRTRYEEIDLIAREDKTIVFVEVKYRSSDRYGTPLEAVDYKKKKRISMGAVSYLGRHNMSLSDTSVRFDVVGICKDEIEHVRNAFEFTGISIR